MGIIDFRVRPPYDFFAQEWFYEKGTLDRFAKQTGLDTSESAKNVSMEMFFKEMEAAGIEKGVVWPRTSFGNFASAETNSLSNTNINDKLVKLVTKYPDKFLAAAAVNMFDIKETQEIIDEFVVEGPLCAIVMEPGLVADLRFDDSKLYPIYEYCSRKNVPIFNTTGMSWNHLSDSTPFAIDNVANDFPSLKIVVSHAEWPWITQAVWTVLTKKNVYLLPDMYMFNHPGWQQYAEAINNPLMNENMLYGSAYPLAGVKEGVEYTMKNIEFKNDTLKQNYFSENAKKLLNI